MAGRLGRNAPKPVASIDHVGLVVDNLAQTLALLREVFDLREVERQPHPDAGLNVSFVDAGTCAIELIEPTGPDSAVRLEAGERARIDHLAVVTAAEDFEPTLAALVERGVEVQPSRPPYPPSRGRPYAMALPHGPNGIKIQVVSER